MQNETSNLEQWVIALQASIDTAKYFIIGFFVLCGGVISCVIYIGKTFKEYTAERFKNVDKRCTACADHNTEEHAKLHGRIDKHIDDHLQNK
jgi:hypothetical protein